MEKFYNLIKQGKRVNHDGINLIIEGQQISNEYKNYYCVNGEEAKFYVIEWYNDDKQFSKEFDIMDSNFDLAINRITGMISNLISF